MASSEISSSWMPSQAEVGVTRVEANGMTSVEQAFARARRGDGESLAQLLDGLRGFVQAIAQGELDPLLWAKFGPSDIVQDTFVRAHQAADQFRGVSEAELQAWLGQIARRRCWDLRQEHVAAAKRDVRREIPWDECGAAAGRLASHPKCDKTPSVQASHCEETERLMRALAALPPDMQEVVVLRNWEGLRFEQVGQRLNRSADAARRLFARAVDRLAKELEAAHETVSRSRAD